MLVMQQRLLWWMAKVRCMHLSNCVHVVTNMKRATWMRIVTIMHMSIMSTVRDPS